MPSDSLPREERGERTTALLAALRDQHRRYFSAVSTAAEQMRAWLRAHQPAPVDVEPEREELGRFATGRIDPHRFAALFDADRTLPAETARPIRRAVSALDDLLVQGDALLSIEVPAGGDLHHAVDGQLAELGRAFGAALVFQVVRLGTYRPELHDPWLASCPFASWNRGERRLAPPIVVSVDGADLRGESLAPFLDGRQKIVLLATGACPPAPLVRLLSPRVFVQQAATVDEIARFLAHDGPGVAALVPETAARFTHDPAGATLADRLTIAHLPGEAPVAAGGQSAWQQREELDQLAALGSLAAAAHRTLPVDLSAIAPALATRDSVASASAAAGPAPDGGDAVNALTSWLLAQAGFEPGTATAESESR